jgi:hypothetical protein
MICPRKRCIKWQSDMTKKHAELRDNSPQPGETLLHSQKV